jgi:low temperature requirement protein LtrA
VALESFLLGVIVMASLTAGVFFARFWRRTRDPLFLAFALAFTIEGLNRIGFLFVAHPNEGAPAIYIVRLLAFLLILSAIVRKNGART